MSSLPLTSAAIGVALGLGLLGAGANAQTVLSPDPNDPERARAFAAAQTCIALGTTGQVSQASAAGAEADALLARYLARHPRDIDARVALARTVSQCLLPAADFADQGELSARAIELLERALEIDPSHWTARFVLATILFRSPSFLGRAGRAAAELDVLLEQQADRTDNPMFARVFEFRGVLHAGAGHADSARFIWMRGAALFPFDSALTRLASPPTPAQGSTRHRPGVAPANAAEASEHVSTTASLEEVRIAASPLPSTVTTAMPSVHVIRRSQILMTAGGTADVFHVVQMQPGATLVTEGSDLHTRGGDPDETALFVNGGRVLTLSRFEGFSGGMFGIIDPHLVRWLRYSSGGFSVRHGNALSGVVEIETEGRPRERMLRAGVSLVEVSGTAGFPADGRVGMWINGRVSNTAALLATHGRGAEFDGAPHSQEALASLIIIPTAMSELRATALLARDDSRRVLTVAGWRGPWHSAGGSNALQLSSQWMLSNAPLLLRANVTGSSRTSDWRFGVLARERRDDNVTGRADVEWTPSNAVAVRAGIEHSSLGMQEGGTAPATASVAPGAPTREAFARGHSEGAGAYLEFDGIRGATSLILGVRGDRLPGEVALTFDPRAAVARRVGRWTWRLSGGVFHQGRERPTLVIPNGGLPSGTPRTATHVVAGVEREGGPTTLRAEAFVKRYTDYVAHGTGSPVTAGTARGLDLSAGHTSGSLTGWLGYSLLDATVRLADGRAVRAPFDVTHSLTATATAHLGTTWSLGSTLRYGTGAPFTPVVGGVERDGRIVPIYGALMGDRLPAYGRLDCRLMRFVRGSGFLLTSYVEVLNVAGRRNVASLSYDTEFQRRQAVHAFFASRTLVVGGELQWR